MSPRLVIFSDIDGTILDGRPVVPQCSLDAIGKCREMNIPIILVSGKTRAEMEYWRLKLGIYDAFIAENGGAIYLPQNEFEQRPENFSDVYIYWKKSPKIDIEYLRRKLKEIEDKYHIGIRGFGDMTVDEVSLITGLDNEAAQLAIMREFDEPFIIEDETPSKVEIAKIGILKKGLRYNYGGSLHHITGNYDKGEGVAIVKAAYLSKHPNIKFAGIGDAYSDLPMLREVDYPFLMRKPDGTHEHFNGVDNFSVTENIGPAGFAEAVERIVRI